MKEKSRLIAKKYESKARLHSTAKRRLLFSPKAEYATAQGKSASSSSRQLGDV